MEYLKYAPLMSATLIAIGWLVGLRISKKLASRAETHFLISSVLGAIESIESKGHDYWSGATRLDAGICRNAFVGAMVQKVEGLRRHFEVLGRRKISCDFAFWLYSLRRAITLDAERVAELTPLERRQRVESISECVQLMRSKIYDEFLSAYPHI